MRDPGQGAVIAVIVAAVIGLGRNPGMTATAGGVGTVEQVRHLAATGCDDAQGPFPKPMAGARGPSLLMTGKPSASVGPWFSKGLASRGLDAPA